MTKLPEQAIILRCLHENWPAEMSMIGDNLATRIVDDALSGKKTEFRAAGGGFNFDLIPYIDTIIAAALLLVALAQYYEDYKVRQQGKQPRDPADSAEQDLVKMLADSIKMLADRLTNEKKVEPGKASKFARLFIRMIGSGR